MNNQNNSEPPTLEARVARLEGAAMLLQQLLGLLLSESPAAGTRLMNGFARPGELRDILLPTAMLDGQIEGAQEMLDAVIGCFARSLPQAD